MVAAQNHSGTPRDLTTSNLIVVPVADDQWGVVAWLWQAYRQDLATVVNGLPYADGRYQCQELSRFPSADGAGYIAWRPHPNTCEDAPIGFAIVDGLQGPRRSVAGFWVASAARRNGAGRTLALDVLARHPGPWTIAFQHDNTGAGDFWRGTADAAFGNGCWSEEQRPVPGRPEVPPDHWIETT
jgi:predicted acetyltransferase